MKPIVIFNKIVIGLNIGTLKDPFWRIEDETQKQTHIVSIFVSNIGFAKCLVFVFLPLMTYVGIMKSTVGTREEIDEPIK